MRLGRTRELSGAHETRCCLTLGKKVRVTKCLYSRNGIPWLRFNSLVRSVMSVCSSAKPYTKRPADGKISSTPS